MVIKSKQILCIMLFYNHVFFTIIFDSVNLIKWQNLIPLWPAFALFALKIYHAHFGMLFFSFTKLYFIRIKKDILVSYKQSAICLFMYSKQINRIKYPPYDYSMWHLSFRDEHNLVNVWSIALQSVSQLGIDWTMYEHF